MTIFSRRAILTTALAGLMGAGLAIPAASAGDMRIAFGDLPGIESIQTLAAIERAKERVQAAPDHTDGERLRHALYESGHLTRVFVRERNRILVVPTGDVERLEARGDYVALHVGPKRHLVQVAIADMERMLDPGRFVRVHRSHIVNLDFVVAFNTDPKGALEVELRSGTRLSVSRSRAQALRNLVL